MIRKFFAVLLCALSVLSAAPYFVDTTLTQPTAGAEVLFSTYTPVAQNGTNTYLLLNSTNSSDTQVITINYLNSAYLQKTANFTLNGNTTGVYTYGSNLAYEIKSSATAQTLALEVVNATLKSNGKNATVKCINYSNVYYVSGTVSYVTNSNNTSSSDLTNYNTSSTAYISTIGLTNITTNGNTYFDTVWYYSNPALTITVFENSTNNVLPAGEYFASTTNFTVASNLNNSWKNDSNHSQGYVNTSITVFPNSDNRTYNVTTNRTTQPAISQGYIIIPSNKLVQNRRNIAQTNVSQCVNATLLFANNQPINTTRWNTSGTAETNVSDFAYVYGVKLASAATGTVSVKSAAGTTLYSVPIGSTSPTDNFASNFCINSNGCRLSSWMNSADGTYKLTAKVFLKNGSYATKAAFWQIAGTSVGLPSFTYGQGERLVFYGTPKLNNTNVTLYYEVN